MAIDFDAIRKKLGQISGQNKKSAFTWRPEEGKDATVRIISFPNNDGQPFVDRWFYYGIGGEKAQAILAPHQFGKRDPIQELINKLRDEGSDASKELCKKLYPKLRTTAAVIVRGEEDKGVRFWTFGKMIYQDLLKLLLDEDYGDITDPDDGRDVKISVTRTPGKAFSDTKITPRGSTSPLSKDAGQMKTWLTTIPKVSDFDELLEAGEIEKLVNSWIAGDTTETAEVTTSVKTSSETIDNDIATLRSSGGGSKPKSKAKVTDDLDDAFAELED